jgi:tRNA U34 5-carboxymethylaminomethyl modifying GTPase MnmE/TrmE
MRSLQGAFSARIDELLQQLVSLRTFVEASIDFPDEEVDFLSDGDVSTPSAHCCVRNCQRSTPPRTTACWFATASRWC